MKKENNLCESEKTEQEIVRDVDIAFNEPFLLEFLKGFNRRANRRMKVFVI